ncbi:MAG: ABC transporter permease [Acidobacteriaceae bacterium]
MNRLITDLRYALRQVRKSPGFAATAILTLALGIGANAVIFTLVDSIMLRPLPFPQQNRLMRIMSSASADIYPKGWIQQLGLHSTAFQAISGYGPNTEMNVSSDASVDREFGAAVTVNTFDTLAIHPMLGTFFSRQDAITGQDQEVVLSDGYWRQHFGGNPAILGQRIRIDGVWRTVLGVMPAGIHFPYSDTQFLIPVSFKGGDPIEAWQTFDLRAIGRLKDGVAPAQAQAELRGLHNVLLPMFPWRMPDSWASDMAVVPLLQVEVGAVRPKLLLLFGAVGLILLIACANVANLTLARTNGREREIAVRGALGASSGRLVQQLLTESLVIGVLAGVVGLMAAAASLQVFVRLLPADTPRLGNVALHGSVLLFAGIASVVAGFLFGLIPAVKASNTVSSQLLDTLRSGSRSFSGKASQFRLSRFLVIGQIASSVVVITVAGLLLHSLYKLSQVNPGFNTDRIVTAEIALDPTACQQTGRCESFFQTLLDRARGIEGTQSVALTDSLPMSGWDTNYVYDAEGHPRQARQGASIATGRTVSSDYFSVLGLQLLRGRLLTPSDASGASRAAVINQSMAERLWPHQNPIGKHLISVDDEAVPAVWDMQKASIVVGVVRNAREGSLVGGYQDEVFLPMTALLPHPTMYVLLRTHIPPSEAAAALRRVVAAIDPQVPVTRVRTLNEVVSASVSAPRSLTLLLLGFGVLAVVIGAVGVYSLIAYIVSWRTREIGIRLALGEQRGRIALGIVKQSLVLAISGSIAGLMAAIAFTRLLHSFLFEVSPLDPLTFCVVSFLMLLIALVAAWLPARRAASVDPMDALRSE